MQEVVDPSIVEVCTEEDISLEQVFFSLLFPLSEWDTKTKGLKKYILCVAETPSGNSRVYFKNKWNFTGDKEKIIQDFCGCHTAFQLSNFTVTNQN